jgi:hypothetical protein
MLSFFCLTFCSKYDIICVLNKVYKGDYMCNHIIFQHSDIVGFRDKRYTICYAGIPDSKIFLSLSGLTYDGNTRRILNITTGRPARSSNEFEFSYGEHSVIFTRSDYDKTHLYVQSRRRIILYLVDLTGDWKLEKKATFIME